MRISGAGSLGHGEEQVVVPFYGAPDCECDNLISSVKTGHELVKMLRNTREM